MIRRFSAFALAALAALSALFLTTGAARAEGRISAIKISGNERVEAETVLSYMDVRQGDPLTQDSLDRIVKSLYRTGLFADVSAMPQGDAVLVHVAENPVINEIAFEGNDKLKDEDLLAEIMIRPRQVFTRTKVQNDVTRLYDLYRRDGRFSVTIDPKVIKLDQNRVNLVFEIDEGAVTKVRTVRFVGNRHFSDDALRGEINTRESHWYSFISADDRYDPDKLAYDGEMLRRFYLSQGYADFRLVSSSAELSQDRQSFYITFTVDEGERYKIGKIDILSSVRGFDPNTLKEYVNFEVGDWYDASDVSSVAEKMTTAMNGMQYAFAVVRPDIERNVQDHTLGIVFRVSETSHTYVERININGNVRTHDKVIRRQFELAEGDPLNKLRLSKSEQNIRDLDYFDKVDVRTEQGSAPDKAVVDVDVSEKSTGEFSVGAGFSTSDGPLADFRVRERNFLGRGQDASLASTIAGRRTEFDASFTEPYFLDRDLSAGVDAFHITRDFQRQSSYDQRRTGGALRLGYPLSEKWRQSLRYQLERNEIKNVDDNASRYIREQEGTRVTSSVSQRLTYDDRDSTLFPTDGLYSWLDTEIAGLGGDAKYVSARLGATWYYPVTEGWVFSLMGEGGAIAGFSGQNVAINDRFFLGGQTLRGFQTSGVGPRDTETNDALGGDYYYRSTAELSFPLGLDEELGVEGHAFTDAGSLWNADGVSGPGVVDEGSLRASGGVGISWRSPFGPIRADLAYPVLKEDYDRKENFRFSFGTRF